MQCLQLTRGDPPATSMKWYFNRTIILPKKGTTWTIDFVLGSSSTSYYKLGVVLINDVLTLRGTYYYLQHGLQFSLNEDLYTDNDGWSKVDYRTITFDAPPTGDLLTWLKANATPQ